MEADRGKSELVDGPREDRLKTLGISAGAAAGR
jgi:hypothetical protein